MAKNNVSHLRCTEYKVINMGDQKYKGSVGTGRMTKELNNHATDGFCLLGMFNHMLILGKIEYDESKK